MHADRRRRSSATSRALVFPNCLSSNLQALMSARSVHHACCQTQRLDVLLVCHCVGGKHAPNVPDAVSSSGVLPRVNALMRLCAKWTDGDSGLHVESVRTLGERSQLWMGTPRVQYLQHHYDYARPLPPPTGFGGVRATLSSGGARSLPASGAPRGAEDWSCLSLNSEMRGMMRSSCP